MDRKNWRLAEIKRLREKLKNEYGLDLGAITNYGVGIDRKVAESSFEHGQESWEFQKAHMLFLQKFLSDSQYETVRGRVRRKT